MFLTSLFLLYSLMTHRRPGWMSFPPRPPRLGTMSLPPHPLPPPSPALVRTRRNPCRRRSRRWWWSHRTSIRRSMTHGTQSWRAAVSGRRRVRWVDIAVMSRDRRRRFPEKGWKGPRCRTRRLRRWWSMRRWGGGDGKSSWSAETSCSNVWRRSSRSTTTISGSSARSRRSAASWRGFVGPRSTVSNVPILPPFVRHPTSPLLGTHSVLKLCVCTRRHYRSAADLLPVMVSKLCIEIAHVRRPRCKYATGRNSSLREASSLCNSPCEI